MVSVSRGCWWSAVGASVSQVIATTLDPGSVASLQFSLRLQELVLGVFAVSVATVILPAMSEQAHRGDLAGLKATLRDSVGLLGFVTLPATAGLLVLGEPIVRLLFQYGQFDEECIPGLVDELIPAEMEVLPGGTKQGGFAMDHTLKQ